MDEIVDFLRARAGDDSVEIDFDVAFSESETGARNRSLAHFMDAFGNLTHPVEPVVGVYFRPCAIAMSCRQLARAGLFLAMEGREPLTGEQLIEPIGRAPDRTPVTHAHLVCCLLLEKKKA